MVLHPIMVRGAVVDKEPSAGGMLRIDFVVRRLNEMYQYLVSKEPSAEGVFHTDCIVCRLSPSIHQVSTVSSTERINSAYPVSH
jgi:hypothetical protein